MEDDGEEPTVFTVKSEGESSYLDTLRRWNGGGELLAGVTAERTYARRAGSSSSTGTHGNHSVSQSVSLPVCQSMEEETVATTASQRSLQQLQLERVWQQQRQQQHRQQHSCSSQTLSFTARVSEWAEWGERARDQGS